MILLETSICFPLAETQNINPLQVIQVPSIAHSIPRERFGPSARPLHWTSISAIVQTVQNPTIESEATPRSFMEKNLIHRNSVLTDASVIVWIPLSTR